MKDHLNQDESNEQLMIEFDKRLATYFPSSHQDFTSPQKEELFTVRSKANQQAGIENQEKPQEQSLSKRLHVIKTFREKAIAIFDTKPLDQRYAKELKATTAFIDIEHQEQELSTFVEHLPQEKEGNYWFSGQILMTQGIRSLLTPDQILLIYSHLRRLIQEKKGLDYLQVFIFKET